MHVLTGIFFWSILSLASSPFRLKWVDVMCIKLSVIRSNVYIWCHRVEYECIVLCKRTLQHNSNYCLHCRCWLPGTHGQCIATYVVFPKGLVIFYMPNRHYSLINVWQWYVQRPHWRFLLEVPYSTNTYQLLRITIWSTYKDFNMHIV